MRIQSHKSKYEEALRSVRLSSPVEILKGIGSRRNAALAKLGVFTLEDLLYLIPRRYEDRRFVSTLSNLIPGRSQCAIAKVIKLTVRQGFTRAVIQDDTGTAKAVWFGHRNFLREGMTLAISGNVDNKYNVNEFVNPEFEVITSPDQKYSVIGRIFPVYPANSDISQRVLRTLINSALENYSEKCVIEFLPEEILKRFGMMSNREALINIHYPKDNTSYIRARNRLAFEELFLLQTGMLLRRQKFSGTNSDSRRAQVLKPGKSFYAFMNKLPFRLTDSQRIAIHEILEDLSRDKPMNRLLQGDVGSGKTLVAFAALLTAGDSGTQSALMAPTEILAWQHYNKLRKSLESLGLRAGFLSGSLGAKERREILQGISNGEINIVIGTHSIFSEHVNFRSLSLVIIDEQHRFGVLQRSELISKGISPHVLAMTATPIPRTLLLSLYGDLDSSRLNELPPGRKAIQTIIITHENFSVLISTIRERILARHEQIYWVCPLIEDSGERDLTSINQAYERLSKILPDVNIAVLHGRMTPDMKAKIMQDFTDNKINLLISTVIIEVGVDVPNASMIVIQDAGNFGLAQLHQLRGRVGRGEAQGVCVLLEGANITPEGRERLNAMIRTSDGFELSEYDLRQRGAGEICGTRQHGINEFRVADLVRDEKILLLARNEARALIKRDSKLDSEPKLKREIYRRLAGSLELAITS